jgi:hypothetical protein
VWSPRWPDDELDPAECVHVKIYSAIPGVFFPDWDLSKGWEWEDSRFLVDTVMKGGPWEAEMANERWRNDGRKPFPNQRITIFPFETPKLIKKEEEWRNDVWKPWVDKHESSCAPGSWTEAMVPDRVGGEESISNDSDS